MRPGKPFACSTRGAELWVWSPWCAVVAPQKAASMYSTRTSTLAVDAVTVSEHRCSRHAWSARCRLGILSVVSSPPSLFRDMMCMRNQTNFRALPTKRCPSNLVPAPVPHLPRVVSTLSLGRFKACQGVYAWHSPDGLRLSSSKRKTRTFHCEFRCRTSLGTYGPDRETDVTRST